MPSSLSAHSNPKHGLRLGIRWLSNSPAEEDVGEMVCTRLNMSLQHCLITNKANDVLDGIRSRARRTGEVIIISCA